MDKLTVRASSLTNLFSGNSSGVIWVNCNHFTQVELVGLTVDGAQAVSSQAVGQFQKCNSDGVKKGTVEE